MTVKELIEALKQIDENKKVVVQFRDEREDYPGQDETIREKQYAIMYLQGKENKRER